MIQQTEICMMTKGLRMFKFHHCVLTVLLAGLFLCACSPSAPIAALPSVTASPLPSLTPTLTPSPAVTATSTPIPLVPNFQHIVIVVFENEEFGSVVGNSKMPYFNKLARSYT